MARTFFNKFLDYIGLEETEIDDSELLDEEADVMPHEDNIVNINRARERARFTWILFILENMPRRVPKFYVAVFMQPSSLCDGRQITRPTYLIVNKS